MPKPKGLKGVELVPQLQTESILPIPVNPLSLEEREEFRKILGTPLLRKIWTNAKGAKPGAGLLKAELNSVLGPVIANNRLHEMRGWDLFEAAILGQAFDPPAARRQPVPDDYPDAGLPK